VKGVKDTEEYIFCTDDEAKSFIEIVVDIAETILKNEANLDAMREEFFINNVNQLDLKDITAMISIDDKFKMNLIFSFDEKLLDYIFKNYTAGLNFEEEEHEFMLGETAGDIINVVLGLSIGRYAASRRVFNLSPPIVVNKARSITRYKDTRLYAANIISQYGNMSLFVVAPGEKVKKRLTT
jgi:CheY-specific phosphatase CheX